MLKFSCPGACPGCPYGNQALFYGDFKTTLNMFRLKILFPLFTKKSLALAVVFSLYVPGFKTTGRSPFGERGGGGSKGVCRFPPWEQPSSTFACEEGKIGEKSTKNIFFRWGCPETWFQHPRSMILPRSETEPTRETKTKKRESIAIPIRYW